MNRFKDRFQETAVRPLPHFSTGSTYEGSTVPWDAVAAQELIQNQIIVAVIGHNDFDTLLL